ncbi:ATP-binding protein [Streptodolium elevatio]|uniref:ATP-binding protein n=1 Tax=Streptodolium elevatio TaxID=3157996 RepID=A0ABV3DTD7_9ACTN
MTHTETSTKQARIDLGLPALIVLVGTAGAGKSRVATAFPAHWRLSLDACRQRVCDNAGDQDATPDAVAVFAAVLDARLTRGLPTVIDATNTESAVRTRLVGRAYAHCMPAVAIVVRTPLEVCLDRQRLRLPDRQVPRRVVAAQHAGIPTTEQLHAEGFDAVHDAAEVDLLGMLLARSAGDYPDLLSEVRAAFGDDLAAVFAWHPDTGDGTGVFAVGGRHLVARLWDGAGVYAPHWQARCDAQRCDRCGGVVWAAVDDAADLLAVYRRQFPDDLHCDPCDTPDDWDLP